MSSYQIIKDIEQGSDEWLNLRLGMITASKFKDVIAGGQGKTRKSYMYQLAAESITGENADSFTNEYMQWGTETEPQARAMYELDTASTVESVAFITMDGRNIGISPDGLIGDNKGIEIKCPKTSTQIETYLSGKMPSIHKAQVQGSMWVTGFDTWDFVSFDPRINGKASYFKTTVERDEDYINELAEKCFKFERELNEMIEQLING